MAVGDKVAAYFRVMAVMRVFLILACLSAIVETQAQQGIRTGLRSPLDIPLNLSGNFGEFRSNHFHTGLDIKTQGKEGLKVYASQAGAVSRVKVGPYGFGNALYIDHPNGLTTVYAHLQSFSPKIDSLLEAEQYRLQTWEIEWYPEPNTLFVDSSEVIGRSGNSGSSGGPHLHYEIRETATEFPLNPLLWDFEIADHQAPMIKGLYVIPVSDTSEVAGGSQEMYIAAVNTTGKVTLQQKGVIDVSGPIGLGIHTIDVLDGNSNLCGIYSIVMSLDGEEVYKQEMDILDFSANRFLNAHALYPAFKKNKSSVHKTYRLPYNRLPIYKTIRDNGQIELQDDQVHTLAVEVKDVHGNKSSCSINIRRVRRKAQSAQSDLAPRGVKVFKYDSVNTLRTDSCNIYMPEGRLYDDADVWIAPRKGDASLYSMLYEIGDRMTPLQDTYVLKIKTREVAPGKEDKLVIMRYDGSKYISLGGAYKLGWMILDIKEFGVFCVGIDDISPTIKQREFVLPKTGTKAQISFNISDNLSGISRYEAKADGEWVRMHWDPKRAFLWYDASDGKITAHTKRFELKVWDERGNVREWTNAP